MSLKQQHFVSQGRNGGSRIYVWICFVYQVSKKKGLKSSWITWIVPLQTMNAVDFHAFWTACIWGWFIYKPFMHMYGIFLWFMASGESHTTNNSVVQVLHLWDPMKNATGLTLAQASPTNALSCECVVTIFASPDIRVLNITISYLSKVYPKDPWIVDTSEKKERSTLDHDCFGSCNSHILVAGGAAHPSGWNIKNWLVVDLPSGNLT